jgi:hypothetical protein
MMDEDVIAYSAIESDDEYFDVMKQINGRDLFRL